MSALHEVALERSNEMVYAQNCILSNASTRLWSAFLALPPPATGSNFIIGPLRDSCWTDIYIIYMKS